MTIRSADKIRQDARAKEQRIEKALEAIDALTSDEAEFVYVKLENKILAARGVEATEPKKTRQAKPKKTSTKKHATKSPSYASRAEAYVTANPQGVRTYEVGKAIGQPTPSAHQTLVLLKEQGRIERHGERNNTLWTPPGVKPIPRVETIDAAIVRVLESKQPTDSGTIRAEVTKLLAPKEFAPESIKTALSKLISKGIVTHRGADEHGALYVLTKKGAPNKETTLN